MRKKETKTTKTRRFHSPDFKQRAIELAKEIGSKKAGEKLGIANLQTFRAWIRNDKKMAENAEFWTIVELEREVKKLKKELEREKKVVAILKDAAAFFSQERLR